MAVVRVFLVLIPEASRPSSLVLQIPIVLMLLLLFRTDGRTGPSAGRALAAPNAGAHRPTERPLGRLHLQLSDGPRAYDERDGHGMLDRDDDDVGA